eukprot:5611886-Pleurochrysis_carterae.AAC.1
MKYPLCRCIRIDLPGASSSEFAPYYLGFLSRMQNAFSLYHRLVARQRGTTRKFTASYTGLQPNERCVNCHALIIAHSASRPSRTGHEQHKGRRGWGWGCRGRGPLPRACRKT